MTPVVPECNNESDRVLYPGQCKNTIITVVIFWKTKNKNHCRFFPWFRFFVNFALHKLFLLGLYAHEVSEERMKNGIPYHKEVLFWYKTFAQRMLDQKKSTIGSAADISEIESMIQLMENEFPAFEISSEEKERWESGPFSGVLGKVSKCGAKDRMI